MVRKSSIGFAVFGILCDDDDDDDDDDGGGGGGDDDDFEAEEDVAYSI